MLENVNERAVRYIFNERSTPYEKLLEKLGMTTLLNQRLAKIVCSVFKALNNPEAPRTITDLLTERSTTYNLRGHNILQQPKVNTSTYGLRSWRHLAPKLWNNLPDSIRTLNTYKTFKTHLRKLDLTGI